jgi:hypothetical protein
MVTMKKFIPTICSGLRKVDMSLYEDFNNGSKAYYDEVPRYKNPYSGEGDESSNYAYAAWEKGWKQSSSEHNLFTENQSLKAEKKKFGIERAESMEENMFLKDDVAKLQENLEVQKMELEGDVQFADETVERFKQDKKIAVTAFDIAVDKMDKLKDQTVVISTLLDEAFYYSTDSTIFSFRREKLIDMIKNLRRKVDAMKDAFPEIIKKDRKKS